MSRFSPIWLLVCGVALCAACGPQVLKYKGNLRTIPGVEMEELEEAYKPRRLALVVGINNFNDTNWHELKFAKRDALELSSILTDPGMGGFDEIVLLTTPEMTTRTSILSAMDYIAKVNSNPRDTVVVYFSTHGTLDRDREGQIRQYLVASDTEMNNIPKTGISLVELNTRFEKLNSRRKALILATCHSGIGKSALSPKLKEELSFTKAGFFVKPIEIVSEASVILSACAWGETAREDNKLKHDIYTHFFLEALRNFDPNQDGATTVSEAHDYAREKTYYFTNGKQRPTAKSDILGSDPIVLAGKVKRAGMPAVFSYNDSLENVLVYVDGTPKGTLPGSIVIEPGSHLIALKKPGHNRTFFRNRAQFSMGKRIDLDQMIKLADVGQTAGPGVSYRAFFSPSVNDSVYSPVVMYGLGYSKKGPFELTRWEIGAYGGNTRGTLVIDGLDRELDFTRVDLDGALLWERQMGRFRFAGGPAIALVYLNRRLLNEEDPQTQAGFAPLFGSRARLEYLPLPRWIVGLGGEVNGMNLTVDSRQRIEAGYSATMYVKFRM